MNIEVLKKFGIYRHLSFTNLINIAICNRIMKNKTIIAYLPSLYRIASKYGAKSLANNLMKVTVNNLFTGGSTIEQLKNRSRHLSNLNIPVVLNYCAQGVYDDQKSTQILDKNAAQFAKTMKSSVNLPGAMTAVKITGLIDMNLLIKVNKSVELRNNIWNNYNKQGYLTAEALLQAFLNFYKGVTDSDIKDYIQKVHNYKGSLEQFKINQFQFKMQHHPYFIYHQQKNDNLITKLLLPLQNRQLFQLKSFRRRLDEIFQIQKDSPSFPRVLIDMEQSYVQRAIECFTQQMQLKYNNQRVYIIPGIQNYLKSSPKRLEYEIQFCKKNSLFFAMKLVRGAYMVQETKLSTQGKYPNPVVDNFEQTTINYITNFQRIINDGGLKGQIFAAGHNQQTIKQLLSIKRNTNTKIKINFAQLFGIGDHLTHWLSLQRQSVYKLIPWAQNEVMVPYMIRRAQELNQMRYPLDTQYKLVSHELRKRLFGW